MLDVETLMARRIAAGAEPVIIVDLVRFGEEQGRMRLSESLVRTRLQRPLTASEQTVLAERVDATTNDEFCEILLHSTRKALEKWLVET